MRILLLFFGLFTLNLVPASRPSQIAQPKDYALFFACNNYQKMDDLKNPIQNARDIASILQRDYSFSTQVVENPSLTDMRKILKQYEEDFQNGRKDAKGQLLLFLTGHGKVESETGFFIPSDGDPDDLYFTSFNYDYWRKVINNFNCQHILVAVDACFSVRFDPKWKGTKNPDFSRPGERTAKDKMLMQHQSKKARFLFTSDGNEKETPDKSNFAKRFQEGLLSKGENDGILTSTELFTYLEMASPTPHCSDFGDDQVGSSFLFMYGGEIANPQSAYLKAVDCGTAPCLRKYIKDYPSSPFANAARAQLTLLEGSAKPNADNDTPPRVITNTDLPIPLPKMIYIEGGSFMMGSEDEDDNEKPVHKVTLSPFYMAETEVTNEQYMAFVNATNSHYPEWMEPGNAYNVKTGTEGHYKSLGDALSKGNHPVVGISWEDAVAYTQWVSQQTGDKYRLPTEAEWEYAAGGGASNRTKYAGTSSSTIDAYAVHNGNSNSQTAAVKSKRPNALGLYDMSGNVWEWCQDWKGTYSSSAQTNPTGPTSGDGRVIRGGSWSSAPRGCRVARRGYNTPTRRSGSFGFRLSRTY